MRDISRQETTLSSPHWCGDTAAITVLLADRETDDAKSERRTLADQALTATTSGGCGYIAQHALAVR
jgi:hypothetical protein